MDNQHKKITGYRDLSQAEIDLMNEGKSLAEQVGKWVEKLDLATCFPNEPGAPDPRWVSIGSMQVQQGFMALIRAIAKPTTF